MRHWFGLLILSVCVPSIVTACDCVYPGRPCKAFAVTPYIFSGKVSKISTISVKAAGGEYQEQLVVFQVAQSYRGLEGKNVTEVVTGFGGGDCGYGFREGEEYLVYARLDSVSGKLHTGICSRTRRLSEAADDLEYFAKKDDPAHGAGIEGWIDEVSRGQDTHTEVIGPLACMRVKVEALTGEPNFLAVAMTDDHGRFRLWGLPARSYRVTPEFSPKFAGDSRTVTLKPKSCEEIRFLATPPPHKKQG